jgi:hypothetical protein
MIWPNFTADQAAQWMVRQRITHVICLNEPTDPRLLALRARGALRRIPFSQVEGKLGEIQVYEVMGK